MTVSWYTRFLALIIFCICGQQLPSYASDASERINISGQQRMLSQRIAKALCTATLLESERHSLEAERAIQIFDRSLHVLRSGDGMTIQEPEKNQDILRALDQVDNLWYRLGPDYWEMSIDHYNPVYVPELLDHNMLLLELSDALVTEIESAYQDDQIDPRGLRAVNRSGRMRMLGERVVKETCFLLMNNHPIYMRETLAKTIAMIETSLSDLETGNDFMRIPPPPQQSIADALSTMRQIWKTLQPSFQDLASGQRIDQKTYIRIYEIAATFVETAELATRLYVSHYSGSVNPASMQHPCSLPEYYNLSVCRTPAGSPHPATQTSVMSPRT